MATPKDCMNMIKNCTHVYNGTEYTKRAGSNGTLAVLPPLSVSPVLLYEHIKSLCLIKWSTDSCNVYCSWVAKCNEAIQFMKSWKGKENHLEKYPIADGSSFRASILSVHTDPYRVWIPKQKKMTSKLSVVNLATDRLQAPIRGPLEWELFFGSITPCFSDLKSWSD